MDNANKTDFSPTRQKCTLDSHLMAIAVVAAADGGLTVEEWLDSRIRACVVTDLKPRFEESRLLRNRLHRWVAGTRPLPAALLPSAEAISEVLAAGSGNPAPEAGSVLDASPGKRGKRSTPAPHILFDATALETARRRVSEKDQAAHFSAMAQHGPLRSLPHFNPSTRTRVAALLDRAPHLSAATEHVLGALAVSRRMGGQMHLPPLLLSGPPAAGKTWWAREIAAALGLPSHTIVLPKVTASFVISGSSMAWSQARPGRIAEGFMDTSSASPIFILDELDKTSKGNYDPETVLLDLLERESARRWRDEFFGVEFDVSRALFIATANHPECIDDALRSRFLEIPVAAPSIAQMEHIIRSAWSEHRLRYKGLRLPARLSSEVVCGLARERTHVRALQRTFDHRRSGSFRLIPADFGVRALRLVSA